MSHCITLPETGRELEDDIVSDTSGHIKHLLVSQSNAGREEEGPVDYDKLEADSDEINEVVIALNSFQIADCLIT